MLTNWPFFGSLSFCRYFFWVQYRGGRVIHENYLARSCMHLTFMRYMKVAEGSKWRRKQMDQNQSSIKWLIMREKQKERGERWWERERERWQTHKLLSLPSSHSLIIHNHALHHLPPSQNIPYTHFFTSIN